ncbi:Anion-transporting ATPase [Aureococcus anophagefferens]|uniref:Anion-transporting ATPase n=1 Tax=Aureococcus anophagefferens TaxID=44056 RepID=A0ABR1GE82_AURAN
MSGCRVGDDVERCRGDRPAAAPRALPGDLPRVLAGKKFVFFTGKGGQGKTSVACATALALADGGRKTLLVSTDPASNLGQALGLADGGLAGVSAAVGAPSSVCGNLWAANAAAAYRKKALRALMARGADDDELDRAEEGLAGQCTVEIAAFDAFAGVLARPDAAYDVVVFDTAPTGHTLRLLGLAWEWTAFFGKSPTGASCLGPVEALAAQAETFAAARAALADGARTALLLVARPESSALAEAARTPLASSRRRRRQLGSCSTGVLETPGDDALARGPPTVVLLVGKGGVGKTTLRGGAGAGLAARRLRTHVTTTDPAAHVAATLGSSIPNLTVDAVDAAAATRAYAERAVAPRAR